jgi:hypothetical protein
MKATTQAILSALANADRGEISGLPLWRHLYPEASVRAAAAAFSDYCHIELNPGETGDLLSLTVHAGTAAEVIGEFLNFLLNHSLQARWQKVQADD